MSWQFTPYLLPLISSAVLPACLALLVLRRPSAAGARAFVGLMLVVAAWSVGYLIELASADAGVEQQLHGVNFVIGDLVPVAWIMFAAHYAGGRGQRLFGGRVRWLLGVVPCGSLVIVASGDPYGLLWSHLEQTADAPFLAVHGDPGAWFWIDTVYAYVVIVTGVAMLGRSLFRSRRLYRQQIVMLLMAVIVPWLAELATSLGL